MEHDLKHLIKNIPDIDPSDINKRQLARIFNQSTEIDLSASSKMFLEQSLYSSLSDALSSCQEKSEEDHLLEIDAKLKRLFAIQAPWSEISLVAWSFYNTKPSEKLAAKLVQLVALNGSHAEVLAVLDRILIHSPRSYFLVAEEFRVFIISIMWMEERVDLIRTLFHKQAASEMIAIEKIYYYLSLISDEQFIAAYEFFKHHGQELVECIVACKDKLGITLDSYFLMTGELALKLGYEVQGRQILAKITPLSKEFSLASELVFNLGLENIEKKENQLVEEFKEAKSWKKRLDFLEALLIKSRKLGAIRDNNRPALDRFLAQLADLCDFTPEVLRGISNLLADHTVLHDRLPHYTSFYERQIGEFHGDTICESIWAPLLNSSSKNKDFDKYWKGIAHFHLFTSYKLRDETHLWRAHRMITESEKRLVGVLPITWKELCQRGRDYFSNNIELEDKARDLILIRFKILADPAAVSKSEIVRLFNATSKIPCSSLEYLAHQVQKNKLINLELQIIRWSGQSYNYTNKELDRLWKISCEMEQPALAWTTATILHSRQALNPTLIHPWQLSFEGKKDILMQMPSRSLWMKLFDDFFDVNRGFLESLMILNSKLADLLEQNSPDISKIKIRPPSADTTLYKVESHLSKIEWVAQHWYSFNFGKERIAVDYAVPPFINKWVDSPYGYLLLALSRNFGFSAFNWSAVYLLNWIKGLFFKSKIYTPENIKSNIAKWLINLKDDEKDAWQYLTKLDGVTFESTQQDLLAIFICRIAILIYPDHLQALETLKNMQVNLVVIRNIESFLVSENYTEIREKMGLKSRALVPISLRRMGSILKTTS